MGKKGKKNRFNQVLDIDISYSSSSVLDGAATIPSDLHLSKEKVTELQRIKAQLPSAPQAVRLEEDIARIPDTGPFRLVLVNVAFSATRREIEEFFLPIHPLYIRTVEEDGQFRGYCFVDFASKADLVTAMEKNGAFLLNRRVTMRIADQNDTSNRRGYGSRDGFNSRRSDYRSRGFDAAGEGGADPSGWTRRAVRPPPPPVAVAGPLPERPIIRLQPRTKPLNGNADEVATSARHAAIFAANRGENGKDLFPNRKTTNNSERIRSPCHRTARGTNGRKTTTATATSSKCMGKAVGDDAELEALLQHHPASCLNCHSLGHLFRPLSSSTSRLSHLLSAASSSVSIHLFPPTLISTSLGSIRVCV
ncbi:eukaryotic translation initiation factor 4b:4h [Echinococcus multilocularis]|uniref:Eukaryotic translation initiation factor 4b:4h n=1 Tax=Echinococcus multilocularis TaxID=6211 RepID=A0A087VXU5_ECHMU|nr:eukaryotic translation initiation factor 4b:4h [Echinococcus multilocularis]